MFKDWYIKKMIEYYRAGDATRAIEYAKMAGVELDKIHEISESYDESNP